MGLVLLLALFPVSLHQSTSLLGFSRPLLHTSSISDDRVGIGFASISTLFRIRSLISNFCDIVSKAVHDLIFNVYINSDIAIESLDLSSISTVLAQPYYKDTISNSSAGSDQILVSVGPDTMADLPNAILNGLEILKISNGERSLDGISSVVDLLPTSKSKKSKLRVIVGSIVGAIAAVCSMVFCYFCLQTTSKSSTTTSTTNSKTATRMWSASSDMGRRIFSFQEIMDSTNKFDESLLIGVGGFRKVYRGILQESTKVFVKRGNPRSEQGLVEFHAEKQNNVNWLTSVLVLNALRRFCYTLDLKREEENLQIRRKIRTHAQVIRAAILFKEAGERIIPGTPGSPKTVTGGYGISQEQLSSITRDHDFSALEEYGGVKGLSDLLKTNLEKGIRGDDSELQIRKNVFGSNSYPQKEGRSFWLFLWEACQDLTLIILMVAAAASLALGMKTEGPKQGWYDGGSIAFAVLLVIFVTAISDYKQSLQFQNLNEEKRNIHMEVVRGGRRIEVSIFDLVVGDVVPLKIGDQVPADGVLIHGRSLGIDESSMTGESMIVHKDQKAPFLMSGCKVADGYGSMLITSVGLNTEWGLLMASISEDNGEETPLQVRLNGVATLIGMVGLGVAVAVLVILLVRYFTGHGSSQFVAGKTKVGTAVDEVIKIFTIAVTIVVVAVPEGLPLAVTLTLAYSMRKMMVDKALVRRLSACETMGSATTICSDKTGTLTLNQMTVVEAYVGGEKIVLPESNDLLHSKASSLLIEGIAQNTTGSVFTPEDGGTADISGSPTEKAILSWGLKLGMVFDDERSKASVLHVVPFSSENKRDGVAVQLTESEVHIHWKGAAELILASCTKWLDQNGIEQQMDNDRLVKFKRAIEDMAAGSLRCVAFAYRLHDMAGVPKDEEQREQWVIPDDDLIMLAIVGMKDPCRPGVRQAVELCKVAGVKVRMVTGDNIQTAKAIAVECGILGLKDEATEPTLIEGKTFRDYSDKEREEIAERICVMGRSSPSDKLLLVQALRKAGHVVAVTGDGTNDAPALSEADIGLAMGIQGTEVAKESSDIIILDDNFSSVVKVVRWGRSVYANIQKFIQFQLTVNVAALIINVVAAISSGDVPLNAVQLLWVNLIMDTLGALALATEPPSDHLMQRRPVGRREPLITNIMWRNLIVQALYQVTVLLILNFAGRSILHLKHDTRDHADKVKNTLIFNAFVFCQIFNEFNARKPDEINVFSGVTRNHLFMGIVGITLLFQVLIIEFLGKFTSTVKLSWKLWLVSVAIGFVSWPLAVVGKLIPVPETPLADLVKRVFTPLADLVKRVFTRGL